MDGETLTMDRGKCMQCAACFGPALFTRRSRHLRLKSCSCLPPRSRCLFWLRQRHRQGQSRYVSYATDITPWCDCTDFSDRAIVPQPGRLRFKDPVAIDMACLEMSEARAGMPGAKADELGFGEPGSERFTNTSGMAQVSQWAQINSGIQNGLGTSEYELIHSVPADETDFYFPPYGPANPWGLVHKEGMQKGNWHFEPYSYDNLQMSFVEMSTRPPGMASERDI